MLSTLTPREVFEKRSVAAAFRLRGDKLKGCRLIARIWYAQPLGCMVINRQAFWPTTPQAEACAYRLRGGEP
ncbi:MAG TPA: hypothetical protein VG537_03185 [Candidatus Kapabacteria bacterium]|nr:hypothetical protein [Candidatus Kapabacteria bacterium]